jgi:hypothetical protein
MCPPESIPLSAGMELGVLAWTCTLNDGWLYYLNALQMQLGALPTQGTATRTVVSGRRIYEIFLAPPYVYYQNRTTDAVRRIERIDTGSGRLEELIEVTAGNLNIQSLRVVNGEIFWVRTFAPGSTPFQFGLEKWTPGAVQVTTLVRYEGYVGGSLVVPEGVFWVDYTGGTVRIMRSELDGSGPRVIRTSTTSATLLASDPDYLYWSENAFEFWRMGHAGAPAVKIAEGDGGNANFGCLQGDDLFLFGPYALIASVPRSGGIPRVLSRDANVAGSNWFAAAGIDDFYVYWISNTGDYWRVAR